MDGTPTDYDEPSTAEADAWIARYASDAALSEHGHHHPMREAFYSWLRKNDDDLRDELVSAGFDLGPGNFNFASWMTAENEGQPPAWEQHTEKIQVIMAWLADEHPDLLNDAEERYQEDQDEKREKAREEAEKNERAEMLLEEPGRVNTNGWTPMSLDFYDNATIDAELALRGWAGDYPSVVAMWQDETGAYDAAEFVLADLIENGGDPATASKNRHITFGDMESRVEVARAVLDHTQLGKRHDKPADGYPFNDDRYGRNGWYVRRWDPDDGGLGQNFELIDPDQDATIHAMSDDDFTGIEVAGERTPTETFEDAVDQAVHISLENTSILGGGDPLDAEVYDPTTEGDGPGDSSSSDDWQSSQRQQTLGGGTKAQAEFEAPPEPDGDPEVIESVEENEGGLMGDTRDDTGPDPAESTQGSLDIGAAARRDAGQDGLDSFDAGDDQPADDPDDQGDDDGEESDIQAEYWDKAVAGKWTPGVIRIISDLDASQAKTLADLTDHAGDVLKFEANGTDWTEFSGIGDKTAKKIRALAGQIEARPGISQYSGSAARLDDDDDQGDDAGEFRSDRMENAHYWAAQLLGWMKDGPNAGLRGTYYVDILGGKPVLVMDGDEWNESHAKAIKDGLRDIDFPLPLRAKETSDGEWRLFVSEPTSDRLVSSYYPGDWREFEATGGDGGDPAAMFQADQLDTWETPNPNAADDSSSTNSDQVTVDLSGWDASITGTALNRLDEYDLADEFEEGTVTVTEDKAQAALDALLDYSKTMEPGFLSIMGKNDDDLRRIESAVQAFEAAGVTADDTYPILRETLESKARVTETSEEREAFVDEMMRDLEDTPLTSEDLRPPPGYSGAEYHTLDDDDFIHSDDVERPGDREAELETPGVEDAMANQGQDADDSTINERITDTQGHPINEADRLTGERIKHIFGSRIGIRKADALANHFDTVGDLLDATPRELEDIDGIGDMTVAKIVDTAPYHGTKTVREHLGDDQPADDADDQPADDADDQGQPFPGDRDDQIERAEVGGIGWDIERGGYRAMGTNSTRIAVEEEENVGNYTVTLDADGGPEYVLAEHAGYKESQRIANQLSNKVTPAVAKKGGDDLRTALSGVPGITLPDELKHDHRDTADDSDPVDADDGEVYDATEDLAADTPSPDALTVAGLKEELDENAGEWSRKQLRSIYEAEVNGRARSTALDAIGKHLDDAETRRGEPVEFGTLDDANAWRDDHPDALHRNDKRSTKTVTLDPDVSDDVRKDAEGAAFTTQDTTKTYPPMSLTDAERQRLEKRTGWNWGTKGFHAQAAKGYLVAEGVGNWTDKYDPDLEAEEHLSLVDQSADMAVREGTTGPGETGEVNDDDPDLAAQAKQAEKFASEACESARDAVEEEGDPDARQYLIEECGYSEADVDRLREQFEEMGEPFDIEGTIYDPATDLDADGQDATEDATADIESGLSFEAWAAENEPGAVEPTDEELAAIAPTPTDEPEKVQDLPGPALRALRKAWGGYRMARQEHRQADERATKYASIINGVRAVNGQDPLTFEDLDGWAGGEVMPDDPTETYPSDEGQITLEQASKMGRVSETIQSTLGAAPYDPTEEF